ncbi:hypothetical protein JX265_011787 [Neoarthrinium moseri]|uniref:Uncharacterized protein n=1 Tax=Neoarthrinium moseri TaxID=1658444 RepID=A0A9P9WC31_9PEZI|nr:hypothetical protein JX265_011787 [Neoarthrinium moseri]
MVSVRYLTVAALAVRANASPAVIQGDPSLQTLQLRGGGGDTFLAGAQLVKEILKAIGVFTESDKKDGWDFKDNKDMCDVFFTTKNGGNCFVTVECNDGGKKEYF